MNKLKNLIGLFLIGFIVFSACDDQPVGFQNPYDDVDYEALALSDNDSIVKFLKTHYFDASANIIREIDASQDALFNDIIDTTIVRNDIEYKLYTYVAKQGIPNPDKGNPTFIDSVFVNYTGVQLINNNIDASPFDNSTQAWLTQTITGWAFGFTNFKGGENITNNGPIAYQNTGEGYIFIPSGLAYPSINYQLGQADNALFDDILVFKVELLDFVENTDHDNDGTPSILEDANKDGDVTNDFSDPSSPTTPDFLNPNIK